MTRLSPDHHAPKGWVCWITRLSLVALVVFLQFCAKSDAASPTCPAPPWQINTGFTPLQCYKPRIEYFQWGFCCGDCSAFAGDGSCISCTPTGTDDLHWWDTKINHYYPSPISDFIAQNCGGYPGAGNNLYLLLSPGTTVWSFACELSNYNIQSQFATSSTPPGGCSATVTRSYTIPANPAATSSISFTRCTYDGGSSPHDVVFVGNLASCPGDRPNWGVIKSKTVTTWPVAPSKTSAPCYCENGGTCVEQPTQVGCQCTPDWTGDTCTIPVDKCKGIDCGMNAQCFSLPNGTYYCECILGYSGTPPSCSKDVTANCSVFDGLGCSECLDSGDALRLNCSWCPQELGQDICLAPNQLGLCPNATVSQPSNLTCPDETTLVNDTNINIIVAYVGDTPNYKIFPRDNCGNVKDDVYVLVSFQTIIERDSNGSFVQAINFPKKGYEISKDKYKAGFKGFLPGTGIQIEINVTTYNTYANVSFADNTFFLAPSSNKWSIRLTGWAFYSLNDILQITVVLSSPDDIGKFTLRSQTSLKSYENLVLANDKFTLSMDLPTVVETDGVSTTATPLFDQPTQTISFYFPAFNSSLYYDPDIGVLLDPNNNGDRNDVCADDSTDWTLLIVLLSTLVPFALCVAGVFFLVLLAVSFRHKISSVFARATGSAVNFDAAGGDDL